LKYSSELDWEAGRRGPVIDRLCTLYRYWARETLGEMELAKDDRCAFAVSGGGSSYTFFDKEQDELARVHGCGDVVAK
jgi:hypothetical protein